MTSSLLQRRKEKWVESFSETTIRADVPSEERELLITFCAAIGGKIEHFCRDHEGSRYNKSFSKLFHLCKILKACILRCNLL